MPKAPKAIKRSPGTASPYPAHASKGSKNPKSKSGIASPANAKAGYRR